MTIHSQRAEAPPIPVFGPDLAPNTALPEPNTGVGSEVVITTPSGEESRVRIFTSRDPRLGSAVEAYAQQLYTDVYLDRKFVSPSQLNDLGVYVDRYARRSTSLYAVNGSKVAAGRMTRSEAKEGGILSLPTTENFSIDPDALCAAAGVSRVRDIKTGAARRLSRDREGEIIEFGGLAARKQKGAKPDADSVKALYAHGLRLSLEAGHKIWVQNVDPGFTRYLGHMIGGNELIHTLGDRQEYMGPATVPIALNPQEVTKSILEGRAGDVSKAYLTQALQGVDDRKMPPDLREVLQNNGVHTTEYPAWKRYVNPKTLLYVGNVGYTVVRDIAASQVEEFDGDLLELMAFDVPLAIPYTWGLIETVAGKNPARRAAAAAVAAGCFTAPYIYYGANVKAGSEYPGYVNGIIAGFIGLAVTREVITRTVGPRIAQKKEQRLREGLQKNIAGVAPPVSPSAKAV